MTSRLSIAASDVGKPTVKGVSRSLSSFADPGKKRMNIDKANIWIQLTTAFAVLVGIGLVVWELQQVRTLTRAQLTNDMFSITAGNHAAMLGENAAALYGFDLEALRPSAEALGITPELVRQPLEEIPADSTCITFMRARAEQSASVR